jgi:polyferredoxin
MATSAPQIFGLMCLVALIAVATGAALEIARRRRGESIIGPSQFRLRMFSAIVWILALGSLSAATLLLWPSPGDNQMARRFLTMVSGAILLLLIGLLLLVYDVWLINQGRKAQEKYFDQQLNLLAQLEIERAKQRQREENPQANSDSSPSDQA